MTKVFYCLTLMGFILPASQSIAFEPKNIVTDIWLYTKYNALPYSYSYQASSNSRKMEIQDITYELEITKPDNLKSLKEWIESHRPGATPTLIWLGTHQIKEKKVDTNFSELEQTLSNWLSTSDYDLKKWLGGRMASTYSYYTTENALELYDLLSNKFCDDSYNFEISVGTIPATLSGSHTSNRWFKNYFNRIKEIKKIGNHLTKPHLISVMLADSKVKGGPSNFDKSGYDRFEVYCDPGRTNDVFKGIKLDYQ